MYKFFKKFGQRYEAAVRMSNDVNTPMNLVQILLLTPRTFCSDKSVYFGIQEEPIQSEIMVVVQARRH